MFVCKIIIQVARSDMDVHSYKSIQHHKYDGGIDILAMIWKKYFDLKSLKRNAFA